MNYTIWFIILEDNSSFSSHSSVLMMVREVMEVHGSLSVKSYRKPAENDLSILNSVRRHHASELSCSVQLSKGSKSNEK